MQSDNQNSIVQALISIAQAIMNKQPMKMRLKYNLSGTPAIANATFTVVAFNTKEWDNTPSWYNPATGRFTPKQAGIYHVDAACGLMSVGDTATLHFVVRKNGTANQSWTRERQSGTGESQVSLSTDIYMDGNTDYFDILAYTSGGATTLTQGPQNTWMDIHYVSD